MPVDITIAFWTFVACVLALFLFGFALGVLAARGRAAPSQYQKVADLSPLLAPIRENLDQYRQQQAQLFGAVGQELKALGSMQARMSEETHNLSRALRGSSNVQGQWGELQLRRVLELAGLSRHLNFQEQVKIDTREGKTLRPDVIIALPGKQCLVVDAKAPLGPYLASMNEDDEALRRQGEAKLAQALRRHAAALGSKQYWARLSNTPEFVVMFVPNDAIWGLAVRAMPDLFEAALNDKVLITTPTSLIGLAKTIAYGWKQQDLAINAAQIADQGGQLYQQLEAITQRFAALGQDLGAAVASYNGLIGAMETQVVPMAQSLVQHHPATVDALTARASIDSARSGPTAMPFGSVVNKRNLGAKPDTSVH